MKKILFSFLILVLASAVFPQQYGWQVLSPASIPGTPDFSDVFFVSDNEGWITSSSHAEIYHTTDGGETFEVQTTLYSCNAIHMLNENVGYAGGASGFIYKTTDGGENWNFYGTMVANLTDISFPPNGDTGYCCGINGNIWSIDSNGVTEMTSNINGNLYSIDFPMNSEEGWTCGGNVIIHFINGIWIGDQVRPTGCYNAIYMVDTLSGWAAGDNGAIIHTSDGQNWATQQTNPAYILTDVFFMNTQEGWVVGSGGGIFHTTNEGTNWNIEGAGLSSSILTGVHFTSQTNGYVVGNEKTLLKYGELTSAENEKIPTEILIYQNYPNPFNPSTTISFSIQEESDIEISIYSIKGQKVKTLVNNRFTQGDHSKIWNSDDDLGKSVSSGIYYYKIKAGNQETVKRMLLLK